MRTIFRKGWAAPLPIQKWASQSFQFGVSLLLVLGLLLPTAQPVLASTAPTFVVTSVVTDSTVTILTYNFPAGEDFTVRMGPYGTQAIGGEVVGVTNSGAGGSFTATYTIPASLRGSYRIDIRMDSNTSGASGYNWFYNNTGSTGYYAPGYNWVPTFNITSVATDSTVTVTTYNFPAGLDFTVRMGAYGTLAVGGIVVGTLNSGSGGSFSATFNIPDALKGSYRIAIRMDSAYYGYYAYNWFYNNTTSGTSGTYLPGYVGVPTFNISSVASDSTVTVVTNNFPAGLDFTVRMGAYGTLGVGGIVIGTINSGSGGSFSATFDIPDALKGSYRIAVRMDSTSYGYYAYNWFYNNTTSGVVYSPAPGYSGYPWIPGYYGYPTFNISSVVANDTVTILTNNFPPNLDFTVLMGPYGSQGIGGIVIGTTNSGSGGVFTATYTIPDALKGSYQIAIRMESSLGYYAYNWFYNNTTY